MNTFNAEELQQIEQLKAKYPDPKAAIMPVLWMAQKKWDWLSEDVLKYVGEVMNLPSAHVQGVASFYTMYFKKPMGKHHVQVCTNVSCMLRGGTELYKHAQEKLGIGNNQATLDGNFSLEEVECMGACGGAPMIAINETFYENIDKAQFDALIEKLS
ncbi:MAG: NAD(P)H-dependent oxidoreductase subunit E [Ignavibacteriae bacterium]|nr:MAG: NAD(P)H-dependent oxidoreductase subunit E [Ignavibacteriota bacterium]